MRIRVFKSIILILAVCLFLFACQNHETSNTAKLLSTRPVDDSAASVIMQTFGLPYPDDFRLDSNALLFYCARSYDTSSLIYLHKNKKIIQGVFYLTLPIYHRFITDYADEKSKLLFFEGYSFVIDSITWKSVIGQADSLLRYKENLNISRNYADGSTYALYYNSQSRHGNSHDEVVYEGFDKFLKGIFLERFMQARKPIMHRAK